MKNFKRILILALAAILTIIPFGMTASAEEYVDNTFTYDFELTSEMADEGYIAVPAAVVDQTFTMTTSHRGADRSYSGTTLQYVISITDANGNAVDNVVKLELYDYNHTTSIHSNEINANGGVTYYTVPIVSGRVYYFKYTKISGTTRTLSVHMQINAY